MGELRDIFKPNRFKNILIIVLFIPSIVLSFLSIDMLRDGFVYWGIQHAIAIIVIGGLLSYLGGSLIDYFIKSRTIKIVIASISALISIIIGFLTLASMTMVCDPVHDMVCDPVHVPTEDEKSWMSVFGSAVDSTDILRQKFQECLEYLNN